MASTSMHFWIGLTAAALLAMYGSASHVDGYRKPPSTTVTVSRTRYNFTVYWQGRSGQPGDEDTFYLLPPVNATSENQFGELFAWDSFLTTLQDANSTKVGRSRGQTTFTSLEQLGELVYWMTYFDTDFDIQGLRVKNGSALYFTGSHYSADTAGGETAVVGGTGSFRYCHGYDLENVLTQAPPILIKLEINIICDSF